MTEATNEMVEQSFQARVGEWMRACFTAEIIADKLERADRFIEESLELVQSTGYSAERAHALVDYVFNRPVGEAFQEVGGVRVTLAALCNPHGLDEEAAAEAELARVWTKIDKIRAKQASKPVGSALPIPTARQSTALKDMRDALEEAREALAKARDTFTRYAREHQRKSEAATHPLDRDERMEKADRNLDMALVCETARQKADSLLAQHGEKHNDGG